MSLKQATQADPSNQRIYLDNSSNVELKLTCDEAVERILTRSPHGFKANHFHTDLRIVLGYTAAIVMIGTSAWAWKIEPEWKDNKLGCLIAVVVYAFLSAIQTIDAYLQGGTIFIGTRQLSPTSKPQLVRIAAQPLPKCTTATEPAADGRRWTTPPTYTLEIEYERHGAAGGETKGKKTVLLGHVGEWITRDGEFVEAIFESKLAASLADVLPSKEE